MCVHDVDSTAPKDAAHTRSHTAVKESDPPPHNSPFLSFFGSTPYISVVLYPVTPPPPPQTHPFSGSTSIIGVWSCILYRIPPLTHLSQDISQAADGHGGAARGARPAVRGRREKDERGATQGVLPPDDPPRRRVLAVSCELRVASC